MKKEVIEKLTCLRCGYSWFPESQKKPKVCPRCNNPKWDKQRRQKHD